MYIAKNTIHFIPGEFITTEKEKYIGEKEELQTIVEGKKLFVNIEPIAIYRDKEQELQNKRILEYRYCTNEKTDFMKIKSILLQMKMEHLKRLYLPFQVLTPEKHFPEKLLEISQLSIVPELYTVVDIRKGSTGYWYTFMNKSTVIATPKNEFGTLLKSSDQELLKQLEMRKKE